ncbi:MAG: type II secretion system protein [Planctomycetota bacterium]|nr:type II secretion system protein [Planctomycetota bacterium]
MSSLANIDRIPRERVRHERIVRSAVMMVVGAFLFLAAVAKAVWPHEAMPAMTYFSSVARSLAFASPLVLLFLVVAFEAFVGLCLLSTRAGGAIVVAVLAMLSVFSGALIIVALDERAPACGCFAGFLRDANAPQGAVFGLLRNAGLGAACVWLLASRPRVPLPGAGPRLSNLVARRGFTLLEVLVCISIATVLAALLASSLGPLRGHVRTTDANALLRQSVVVLDQYASDSRDAFPYFHTEADPYGPVVLPTCELPASNLGYFRCGIFWWPNAIPSYVDPGFLQQLRLDPTSNPFADTYAIPQDVHCSRVGLSATVFADPALWTRSGQVERSDWPLFRGVHAYEVTFPSSKGLVADFRSALFDPVAPQRELALNAAAVDGSVRSLAFEENSPRVVNRGLGAAPFEVISTLGGVRGRDY